MLTIEPNAFTMPIPAILQPSACMASARPAGRRAVAGNACACARVRLVIIGLVVDTVQDSRTVGLLLD